MSTLLEQASLVLIPSGYKEDVVYSQIPTDGSGDLSFTRASNGTRVNSAGLVEVCPWNMLQQSETFDNASWSKLGATVTANDITAPNGTLTADKVVFSGANNSIYQAVSLNGEVATRFVYIKGTAGETISIDDIYVSQPNITLTGDWQLIGFTSATPSLRGFGISTYGGATARTIWLWGAQLNIGSTAKPYFPTTDRLNVPRLTYQNGGGGCPSLLLEKQSTNILTYSEDFSNAAWTKTDLTVIANAITSPDGTTNAQKIVPNTTNGTHYIDQFVTISSVDYTYTIYAKKGEYNYLYVNAYSNSSRRTWFDLNSGTVSLNTSPNIATIESVGNGWYRCTITNTSSGTTGAFQFGADPNNGTINANPSFSGDGTSGIYVWGAQLEASSYATSYIPTTSASATRVADACSKTGISSLIGQTEGTIYWEGYVTPCGASNSMASVEVLNTTFINLRLTDINRIELDTAGLSTDFTITSSSPATSGTYYKIAGAYKSGNNVLYVNGVQIGTSATTYTTPTLTDFNFNVWNVFNEQKTVGQAILFKTRLTNAELASLTTL